MSAQRELKFRAWVKSVERMVDLRSVGTNVHIPFAENGEYPFPHGVPYGAAIVMQYTGLKDKNGKEIYEGDIVRWDEVNSEVYYEGSGFYFQPFAWPHTPLSLSMADDGDIEVIGNIHEHPHLIAEKAGAQAREGSKASTPQRDSARSTAVEPDGEERTGTPNPL